MFSVFVGDHFTGSTQACCWFQRVTECDVGRNVGSCELVGSRVALSVGNNDGDFVGELLLGLIVS